MSAEMEVTSRLGITCDYVNRVLRIYENPSPPGFNPIWVEIAQLKSETEEQNFNIHGTQLNKLIDETQDEDILSSVMWFWYDMGAESYQDE